MTADRTARPLRILEHGVYRGPHLYSRRPMIRIQLDLGDLEDWPTDTLPGFADALLAALPTLQRHHCSLGRPGGFVERLREGTWIGHVVEHVALELQSLAGAAATRGKTRSVKGRPGVYNVMFAYEDEETGLLAGRLALQIVDALLPPDRSGVEGLERLTRGTESPLSRRPCRCCARLAAAAPSAPAPAPLWTKPAVAGSP